MNINPRATRTRDNPMPSRRDFIRGAAGTGIGVMIAGTIQPGRVAATPVNDFPTALPGPFAHGVASGDPLSDRVIIWTRVIPGGTTAPEKVTWSMATDPSLQDVVASGTQSATSDHDWAIKVDVVGLRPATTYYYQFSSAGNESIVGRTRTAPSDTVESVRVAVMSCTSYWSSWWSGLGHLADRNDIDLVIHLGDYIYDFVDKDEQVRSRAGFDKMSHPDNRDWLDLSENRRRYALWRSDPNLLRAHQQHPWTIVWDNHDIDTEYANELTIGGVNTGGHRVSLADTTRAFHEWTPTRPVKADGSGDFVLIDDGSYPVPPDPLLIYRRLGYGPMLDIFALDAQSGLPDHGLAVDSSHLSSGPSLLGRQQFDWITNGLASSAAAGVRWRLIANQSMLSPLDVPDVVDGVTLPKLEISRWVKYPEERDALICALRGDGQGQTRVRRNIMVSGDQHGNFASDITTAGSGYLPGTPGFNTRSGAQPGNSAAGAVRTTTGNHRGENNRKRSVGVEFAPSSMGRGGLDDSVAGPLGVPIESVVGLTNAANAAIMGLSANAQFVEWAEHGYGIVHVTADNAVFEHWWQNKYVKGAPDVLGQQMVAWAEDNQALDPPRYRDQIDDVRLHGLAVRPTSGTRRSAPAPAPIDL